MWSAIENMPADQPLLIAPDGIDLFACTGCGHCCQLWGIQIDPASFARAQAFLENPPEPRPHPELEWFMEEGGARHYNLTPDGRCVFLDRDRLCYLHKHDPMLKSIVCRSYPFEETLTPRGRERTLSFSSFGAFEHVLCRPEPFRLVRKPLPPGTTLPDFGAPAIMHPRPFSWKTLFLIEETLLDFIGAAPNLDDALAHAAHFLSAVEQHEDGKKLRRAIAAKEVHPAAFAKANAVSDLESAWTLIDRIVRFRVLFLKDQPLLARACAEVEALIAAMETGPVADAVGPALFYRRMRRRWYAPAEKTMTPLLRKFLLYKIFKKTLFLELGLVRGFNILCFMYAVVRLKLMLDARRADRAAATRDLFDPLHFVEVHFAHSGKFLQFWKEIFKSDMLASALIAEILVRA